MRAHASQTSTKGAGDSAQAQRKGAPLKIEKGLFREREKVSFINENTPRAPTGPKNTRKPARLAILEY
jgi:hypothetical protein